ncbi:hypothetical protein COCVIDRAFT_114634 [Bipolaris victoriae FI3]|uniref:Uncharacterized protein n=2 Tax=Bipolaris TaxID=33194 RepID=W6YEE8_COCC2|nr:uncharacterized protein COCCADRAFT_94786 [Bipolaris zeicola 26-R-13]XP_014550777.1 hypothetical protein COCVIDRAFT_114634 [Bipolaris victoriae FI3]EUC33879.1 hypothetical protein COCCADRAFT_94786 [Bipolaris zeicola 26-R-13]
MWISHQMHACTIIVFVFLYFNHKSQELEGFAVSHTVLSPFPNQDQNKGETCKDSTRVS